MTHLARCNPPPSQQFPASVCVVRYRVVHIAARITHGARQIRLRIDATWCWARAIATAWRRIREVFT